MNVFDITEIEDEMKGIISSLGVSGNVFTNRPKSSEHSSDFVVVHVTGRVTDRGTYGICTVSVQLFAKDVANVKNGKKLSSMYRKLVSGLPPGSGRLLFDTAPDIIGDTPDDYGYHARIINIETIIKTEK